MTYSDWETFFVNNSDRLYHFVVYRRMFTPYEQRECFSDESQFEQDIWRFGFIREAVLLPDGDILLGIQEVFDEIPADRENTREYYKLSELRLGYREDDIQMFVEEVYREED